ncbi:3-methyl-2-oxobutanoate hydroxymethyltransferase [Paenibacillus sp. 598K]|uniref:3-methyl-2-oxobutanoate hydroxymethyltransferase n=1 Tax=Paenibacillus sp. 598K TaxID=1117987 RepID=UPI000FFA0E5C|nr:3-methyl-2-oxobutanoate hydroxymethyltransferase [Paenibacillus sp. 598K]GBF72804.1 3-methyl-2-oxobutanoate hydroxymethyltransferase [Paenibacillus sp. 598K]
MKTPLTVTKMKQMKRQGQPISFITAYDYPSARLAEEAGIDAILVGDSLGNVVLGYDTTIPVTIDDMVYHTRAVARGATQTFILADMPFMSYHTGMETTLRNAARLMQEGLAHAVKLEGGEEIADEVRACVRGGIPVVGHLGLTPQSVHQLGGYRVQGKQEADAKRLLSDARALEQAGASAIVLEMVVASVAAEITAAVSIPTIGIGAGQDCDGQVLVYHDILQYDAAYKKKKFVRTYADIGTTIREAIGAYASDVREGRFPTEEHSFTSEAAAPAAVYGSGKEQEPS